MMKLIINADDCGKDAIVNEHIETAILRKRISSTTIMANMHDFEGAIHLYDKYKSEVSFGVHLNFTEGRPLIYSQELLDLGFYKQEGDIIEMNGSLYRNKIISKTAKKAIKNEMKEQITKILDNRVKISHIDSHHFIHHSLVMLRILPQLLEEFSIYKTRIVRNYMPASISRMMRNAWPVVIGLQRKGLIYTDWFLSYNEFHTLFEKGNIFYNDHDSIELMCHPGNEIYKDEEQLLINTEIEKKYNCKLINYNQL